MTINTTVSRVNALGNGSATVFSFSPVIITQASDLMVWLLDNVGNQTLLSQGAGPAQYVINTPITYPGTGSITYPGNGGTTLAAGWTLVMKQRAAFLQQFQPQNQGPFLASSYGNAFDYVTLLAQDLQEQVTRAICAPETDPAVQLTLPSATARANQYAAFDSAGNPIAALSAPGTVPVSSVMQPVVNASSTVLALSLLSGAPTLANVAALRAFAVATPPPALLIGGFYTSGDGAGGGFVYVSTDVSTADNGGTIIVDAASRRWYRLGENNSFNVRHFGAKGDGATDDTTAITKAIAACGVAGGGTVEFPLGNYAISSTLNLGNGTNSSASTISGVVLRGQGQPISPPSWPGYQATGPTTLTWLVGGGANPMIKVNGPLQGWGIQNLMLNGASTALIGVAIVSAQFGDIRNVAIQGCVNTALSTSTYAIFGSLTMTNTMHNTYENLNILMPDVLHVKGIVLTGLAGDVTADTCYEVFTNVTIVLAATQACYGLYLQNVENSTFSNLHFAGGSSASSAVTFDYTASGSTHPWPSGCTFIGVDTRANQSGLTEWAASGTAGASCRPHGILFLDEDNGAPFPSLANISIPPRVMGPRINLLSQTASISGTTIITPYASGLYRINIYLALTASGNNVTVGASVGWTDASGAGRTFSTAAINFNTGVNNPQLTSITVYATTAAAITYSTTVSGGVGGGAYQLAIAVEKLS